MTLLPRIFTTALLVAGGGASALAQTTYNWLGADTDSWTVGASWDQGTAPGSNAGGAATDQVVIESTAAGQVRARIIGTDVGEIQSLQIGGGITGGDTRLEVRGAGGALTVGDSVMQNGLVTLGGVDGANQRAGQLYLNNNVTSVTINGNIVSGSTAGANAIQIAGNPGNTLTLHGDIDSMAARTAAGLTSTDAANEIDLVINRTLNLAGAGAQELNVENFYLNNSTGNINTVLTLAAGKTVNAQGGRIGRQNDNNNNRTASGTLNVYGGSATYNGALQIGIVNDDTAGSTDSATGNLNVGDGANVGSVTVEGLTTLGAQTLSGEVGQSAIGNLTVDTAGSVVNLNGGLSLASSMGGTVTSNVTVNDGLLAVSGSILDGSGSSTITVNGGELALLDAGGGTRNVDTLSHAGTGVMNFTVYGGMPSLDTVDTALSGSTGGSVFDITTAAPGTTVSTTDQNTWTGGGTGATPDGTWDSEGTDWNAGLTPDGSFGAIGAGENFTLVTSTNAITGDGSAAALTGSALGAGWSIAQNPNDVSVTAGSAIAGGVGVAHFNDGAADVVRNTDLNIAADVSGVDASQIDIDDINSLSVNANLNLGNANAGGIVNQGNIGGGSTGNMDVGVSGDVVLADGSEYRLNEGTLDVGGMSLTGTALDGELIINSPVANSFTSNGPVTVDHLRVGQDTTSNASITIDYTLNSRVVDIAEDGAAQGSVTIDAGGTLNSNGRLYIAGDQTGNQDENTVGSLTLNPGGALNVTAGSMNVGRDGDGTFTVEGGVYTQFAGSLVLGQNGTNPDTSKGTLIVNGGILNIGEGTDAATPNLNINSGGGSVTQNDGVVTIENNLQLSDSGLNSGENPSSYSINGGTLTVANNLDYRGGTGTDTVTISGGTVDIGGTVDMDTASTNLLVIDGSAPISVNIGNDLEIGATGTVQFNLDDSGVQTVTIDDQLKLVGGASNIAFDFINFTLDSADTLGDIDLIVAMGLGDDGNQGIGEQVWSTAYGTQVSPTFSDGTWYNLQERTGSLIVYLDAVPEPGSVLLLALGGLALGMRRHRRS